MFGKQVVEFSNIEKIPIGYLERIRVGAWMSWVYFLYQDCYLSASCSDEVREKQRQLNSRKQNKQM